MSNYKQKIGIACQGGGSQTAFTAGVLKALFENNIHHQKDIVGLTGTSGGALNAALAWYGLLKVAKGDDTPIGKRIADFWEDLVAKGPMELFLDQTATASLRGVSEGLLPMFEISPSNPWMQWMQFILSKALPGERFTNFKGLLEDHIKFNELESLQEPDSPVLLMGAANVLQGDLKIFSSYKGEISVEAILASAAIPNVFPAVQIGEDYYWDGLFSANPPIDELLQPRYMGKGNIPHEVWVIMINPITCKSVPTMPSEIVDRRNEMIGNVSVLQDLEMLAAMERLREHGAFKLDVLTEWGYHTAEGGSRIRLIHMSKEVQDSLDYPSKLSRNPDQIHKLMADGEKQGREFIANLSRPGLTVAEALRDLKRQPGEKWIGN